MNITNNLGLPKPIVRALEGQADDYKATHSGEKPENYLSVTELIAPAQQVALKKEHDEELEQDASDMMFALMGTAMHKVLEGNGGPGDVIEERYYRNVGGYVLSGMVDLYRPDDALVQDYKVMSVWEIILGGLSPEKVQQLNVLSYLIDPQVQHKLEIVAIFRDWQKSKAAREANYPQSSCMVIPVEAWPKEHTLQFIEHRIKMHHMAREGLRVDCTDEERWYSGTKYAVMKKGRKSAVKVCDNHKQAFAISEKDPAMYVDKRPGLSRRCADYCPVGKDTGICPQWRKEQEEA